jgi:hypothetical protein
MPYHDLRKTTNDLLKVTHDGSFSGSRDGGTKFQHPCFAKVSFSRITGTFGNGRLFQNNVESHSAICLRITHASLTRDLSHDWVHGEAIPIIEVYLSPAQFADLLVNMNTDGAPGTIISHKDGDDVFHYAMPTNMESQAATVKKEFDNFCDKIELGPTAEETAQFKALIAKLPKKNQEALEALYIGRAERAKGTVKYIRNQFEDTMENTVTQAKAEVDAFVSSLVQRTGITALKGHQPPTLLMGEIPNATLEIKGEGVQDG